MRHAADSAAYEAARAVIIPGAKSADATSLANDLLARAGFTGATLTIQPSVIQEATEKVSVRVQVPLSSNSWLPALLTSNYEVSRETTLMTERVPVIQVAAVPTPPAPPNNNNGSSWSSGSYGDSSNDSNSDDSHDDSDSNDDGFDDSYSGGQNNSSNSGSSGGSDSIITAPPPPQL